MGTKTSPGSSSARLGLNKSPLITGRPRPGPQPVVEQSSGLVPASAVAVRGPGSLLGRPSRKPKAPIPLTDDGLA